jgi:precorrin-2 dehydrogenase/sirohydrochlorin ferrochelatase
MYPLFLSLTNRRCLVVGGGKIAQRKIASLLQEKATVTVVSPMVTEPIKNWAAQQLITLHQRIYMNKEAAEYYLIFAATNSEAVNKTVFDDAEAAQRLVNVVDNPPLCSFYAGATVRRGPLSVAISTSGTFPALAKKLRRDYQSLLPSAYGPLLERLEVFRVQLMGSVADAAVRQKICTDIANAPEIDRFLEGDSQPLEKLLAQCICS